MFKQLGTAAALFALSTSVKSADSGKGSLGVNYLILDEDVVEKKVLCSSSIDSENRGDITIAVDPLSTRWIESVFTVSDIHPSNQDHILFLAYSTGLFSPPQLLTPISKKKLELDLTHAEIAAIYNIPKQLMIAQPDTRIGLAVPALTSKVSFKVNLDTRKIPDLIRNGQPTIYLQAALIRKTDFDSGVFANMILSETDKITFKANDCSAGSVEITGK